MRKLLTLTMITLMLVAFGVATAEADVTAPISVTVTLTRTLSVSVGPAAWAVGSVTENEVRATGVAGVSANFTATNDGNSSEDLTTTVGVSTSGWTAGATPGADVFVMKQSTDLGANWVDISGAGASLATGLAKAGEQDFDLQFTAPDSTDDGGTAQTIAVTVTAS